MWITTKSIVKDIKRKQEDFAVRLEEIVIMQSENEQRMQNRMINLLERMGSLEDNYSNIFRLIEGNSKLLNSLPDHMIAEFESSNQNIKDQIINSSQNESRTIIDTIQKSVDKVGNDTRESVSYLENRLKDEVQNLKDYSTSIGEKNISLIRDELTERIDRLEAGVQTVGTELTHSHNEIADGIEHMYCAIQGMAELSYTRENALTENIEKMNIGMQEIMRYLLSLDEENRLIIARLLLKDMEI